ncbi:hypothetical protein RRG08_038736 [Elysia crispata]|uniref:Methyltransferase type 11 domain-containing protein n=1 Tax=Elysia crispata TaxID=231223 RepID=A0AAE0Y8H1_9GAST|nr:hypothetical protein RRG08_038736 [Elysia crispata]
MIEDYEEFTSRGSTRESAENHYFTDALRFSARNWATEDAVKMTSDHLASFAKLMSYNVPSSALFDDEEQSRAYAESRPSYTEEVFHTVVEFCRESSPDLSLAVDVGCGPGMSTIGFATYFQKIIGVDISETQIACAPRNIPNCEFKVGCAHNLQFITSGTVDLFCSGQSFHWLPQEETFAEADRVLKPGGTIAIFGYDLSTADVPEVQACIQKIWMKLIPFYPRDCIQALHNLHTRNLPYPDQTRTDELKLSRRCTVQQYVDFMKSTWPIRAHRLAHPGEDMLGDIASLLTEALEKSEAGNDFLVTWNFYIIMARKPRN